jgi:hypothetical protein
LWPENTRTKEIEIIVMIQYHNNNKTMRKNSKNGEKLFFDEKHSWSPLTVCLKVKEPNDQRIRDKLSARTYETDVK